MRLTNADLANAMQAFAMANTPLFVVRKLKTDPTVVALARDHSAEEIMRGLMKAIATKAVDLKTAVLPYVYLVALALKQDLGALDVARRLNGASHDWYNYIANALFQMTPAISVTQHKISTAGASISADVKAQPHYNYHSIMINP